MYLWPLRRSGLAWLAGMAFVAGVFDLVGGINAVVAILLGAVWWLAAFKLASEALTRAADGRDDDGGYEVFASDAVAFKQVWLGLLLFVIGSGASKFAPHGAYLAFCVLVAIMLPAAVILIVMDDSLLRVLDPRMWFELLRRIGADYLLLCAQLAGLAIVVVLLIRGSAMVLQSGPAEALAHGLFLYLLLVAYHGLGELLHRQRQALELPDAPPPSRRLLAATPEETAAVAEAEGLLADDKAAPAAAVLDRLIRGRGATAPVHRRYRELLARLGDEPGLLRHASEYVAVLLHLGQPREALALYLDSKQRDPGFQLADPQPVSDLIAIAARNQQSKLAVALYEEFAQRFPRDRDLVLNGLTAARLMDRLDRDEDARRLLAELLRRFPEHDLRPQLEAALLAIGAGGEVAGHGRKS
jgi:tetratricopeptide (TPR) repeat protein